MASGEYLPDIVNIKLSENDVLSRPSTQLVTSPVDNTLTPELSSRVFGIESIREKILDFVIYDGCVLSWENLRTCRLVQWDWLDYISHVLQKLGRPLFTIDFKYWKNTVEEDNTSEKPLIHNFIDTWVTTADAGGRVPLFKLVFYKNYPFGIPDAGLHDLVRCLTWCGLGLHSLTLSLDATSFDDRVNFSVATDEIHLPNLKSLDVTLETVNGNGRIDSLLLPPILSSCKQLKSLKVTCWSKINCFFDDLQSPLPSTLETIKFYEDMVSQRLESLLLQNPLPNLKNLTITIPDDGGGDVIFRVVDRFRHQLKQFSIYGENNESARTIIDFPVMSKLVKLDVFAMRYEWPENVSSLEKLFPVLETVNLEDQSSSMLRKWIQSSYFSFVKSVTINIDDVNNVDQDFTLEMSRQLYSAFHNVRELDISVCGSIEDGAIQNIFRVMVHLRTLSIEHIYSNENWDSILLGVTPEYAEDLASSRDRWDSINLDHHRPSSDSIVNLSVLERLQLDSYGSDEERTLISDVSFRFAFLCMPNLQNLELNGSFQASDEMVDEWRARGREIFNND